MTTFAELYKSLTFSCFVPLFAELAWVVATLH